VPSKNGSGVAVICEGEKAADAASAVGLRAYGTATGASSAPSVEVLAQFKGQPVVIWPDADGPGKKHALLLAQRLEGIATSVKLIDWGSQLGDDAADFVARGGTPEQARALVDSAKPLKADPLVMLAESVKPAIGELDRLDIGDWSRHVTTGILSLDRKLMGGLRFGEMTLIGAPTGAGKTTLVVQFAMSAQEKGLVVVVSPEMSARSLTEREIVRRSGYPKDDRAPWSEDWKRDRARDAHAKAANALVLNPPNVAIYDSMSVTLDEVTAAVRLRAAREKVVLIALDYAQQLADIEGNERRDLAVGKVAHRAIEMAREFDCHVIVTSQVNTRLEGKVKTYTFRESAQLEQKAHNALLFIVEWDPETRCPLSAFFQTTKMRDNAQFRLNVEFDAKTFQVNDESQEKRLGATEMRDWAN
jgi:RecA/RadA recombinase